MSRNLAMTPEAVRAGGGSMSLWVLRLFSATSPTSPVSAASARTDSSCRPWGAECEEQGEARGCMSTFSGIFSSYVYSWQAPNFPIPSAHPLLEMAHLPPLHQV